MTLFTQKYGIIVACDVSGLQTFERLVRELADVEYIVGFKIGMVLALRYGLHKPLEVIKNYTTKPVLYDHQKFGTDIPEVCGGEVLHIIRDTGVDGLIIFPHSGSETLKATIKGCRNNTLEPIVGGIMTHTGFLASEGGYISDEVSEKMYRDAAALAVEHFVFPGTRIEGMKRVMQAITDQIKNPKILFPGVGQGQGGDIRKVFQTLYPLPSYAIVGRSIYRSSDMKSAAKKLWEEVADLC